MELLTIFAYIFDLLELFKECFMGANGAQHIYGSELHSQYSSYTCTYGIVIDYEYEHIPAFFGAYKIEIVFTPFSSRWDTVKSIIMVAF
jgi:hypothetical protein